MDTKIYHPVIPPTVTEEAGTRGGTHMGRDYAAARGQAVYAPISGKVIYAGGDGASGRLPGTNIWANGEALVVRIQREDGFIAHVAHMDFMSVSVGQYVVGGQTVIGGAGDTGWSTGVHVHVEYRWDLMWNGGNWVDPRNLTLSIPGQDAAPAPSPTKKRKKKMDYATVCVDSGSKAGAEILFNAMVFCLGNGEVHEFQSTAGYIDNIAKTYGTGPKSIITSSHYNKIKSELAATRKRHDARR